MDSLGLPSSFGSQKSVYSRGGHKKQRCVSFHITKEVEDIFNKCFSFFHGDVHSKNNCCKLPEPSKLFTEDKWQVAELQELKTLLNHTKSKLNDLNLKEWHLHTTNTNVAGEVVKKLKYSVAPEFLTQAWCKMYECLMTSWLMPKDLKNGVFNSLHLCEAPGAFITALHHYLQTWYPEAEWNWLATTLNPYHESNPLSQMIQDDRFILHTLPHWTFGEDGTGNLMDKNNLFHLQDQVQSKLPGGVMLVTADGSIDCQINPAEQEALVAPLHYCEALTALTILEPGGCFLLKMFTLLESDSICLLYLLVCVFNYVSVFKPVKSKEGNSEVYVICTEYVGKEHLAPLMPLLLQKFGALIPRAIFSESDIPEEFKVQVYNCAKMFADIQVMVIERNLDLYFNPTPQKLFHTKIIKDLVAEKYLDHYSIQHINKVVVGNNVLADTPSLNFAQKYEEGSFNDRQEKACQGNQQRVEQLWLSLQDLGCRWPFPDPICWFMFNNLKQPPLEMMSGRPVMSVCSSKFCNGRILNVFNQVSAAKLTKSLEVEVLTSATVDASQLPWESQTSHSHLLLLQLLTDALNNLPATKSICIQGLPLLSQVTVAIIFLLAHSFYQLGLSKSGNVFLCGYKQALGSLSWIEDVVSEMRHLKDKAVLSILPISVLCDKSYCMESGVSLYVSVSCINNSRLLSSIESEVQRVHSLNK